MVSTVSRSAVVLTLLALATAARAHPVFQSASVVNAASFLPGELAGGAIARGSIFTIFGAALGPGELRSAEGYPLPTTLAGVSVTISAPGVTPLPVVLLFVTRTQINAIMPSNAPLGDADLRVIFDDGDGSPTSQPVAVRIVEASFGLFSVSSSGDGPASALNFVSESEQPLNSPSNSALRGQYITLWGTGLGAAQGGDALPPGEQGGVFDRAASLGLEVFVGGAKAQEILYAGRSPQFAGLDQIVFRIPDQAPLGCYTPVAVRIRGALVSNFVTMSVAAEPGACQDPLNAYWSGPAEQSALGSVLLSRLVHSASGGVSVNDSAVGLFGRPASRDRHFSPSLSAPPVGACTSYAERNSFGGLAIRPFATALDAGGTLTVRGPRGERSAAATAPGVYQASLASSNALPGYLEAGEYTVTSGGGGGVGAFEASATFPAPPQWQVASGRVVSRSQPLVVTWQPDPGAGGYIWIFGVVSDSASLTSNVTTTFFCTAADSAGMITIPTEALANLPASLGSGEVTTADLWVARHSLPTDNPFEAEGLDYGFVETLAARGVPIEVR